MVLVFLTKPDFWEEINASDRNLIVLVWTVDDARRFLTEARAQSGHTEQACLDYVMKGNLAWNKDGASAWHEPNARSLCAGTPISDYPTKCFVAAIKVGLNRQQGIELYRYGFNSCVYQAMTQKGMRIGNDAKVQAGAANFEHEVYQCQFGR